MGWPDDFTVQRLGDTNPHRNITITKTDITPDTQQGAWCYTEHNGTDWGAGFTTNFAQTDLSGSKTKTSDFEVLFGYKISFS